MIASLNETVMASGVMHARAIVRGVIVWIALT